VPSSDRNIVFVQYECVAIFEGSISRTGMDESAFSPTAAKNGPHQSCRRKRTQNEPNYDLCRRGNSLSVNFNHGTMRHAVVEDFTQSQPDYL
jgi:hypothetical protein